MKCYDESHILPEGEGIKNSGADFKIRGNIYAIISLSFAGLHAPHLSNERILPLYAILCPKLLIMRNPVHGSVQDIKHAPHFSTSGVPVVSE
jgi:hypothetical protein